MKKVFILGFALLLFSCSQEDPAPLNSSESKDVSTIDSLIGYTSPYYEYDRSVSRLQTGSIKYVFKNKTNLTFVVRPYFGLAYFDFLDSNERFRGFVIATPGVGLYSPHLVANGKKFGNFIPSHYLSGITLINSSKSIISESNQVTVPTPSFSFGDTFFDFSQGNPDGVATTSGEEVLVPRFGKLFFAEVEVYESGYLIHKTYLKADFPVVNSSAIYSNTGDWVTLYNDSFFNEKMVYNIKSKEICIPNTELSTYLSKETFEYGGKTYKLGIASTTSKVEVYLK
ncbi:hypothetical protein [Myroides odoratus]|uniref:hypothetical protein n=1 Tax=Myroides odoratus TaxID=256 RepID=UPI0033419E9F